MTNDQTSMLQKKNSFPYIMVETKERKRTKATSH